MPVVGDADAIGVAARHQKAAWVHQNLPQCRVVVVRPIQQQQARLRSNRDTHFIGDGLPRATQKRLFSNEHLNVLLKL